MLNYANLNDMEFEYLCKDIMSRILKTTLRRFGPGKDGGVDLTNDLSAKDIVIQVKHYIQTNTSGLISSLRSELKKINKIKPNQYYICCSKQLTRNNISEIYSMFSAYMKSPENIITITEIDEFLSRPENADILEKHFKLWIESTSVLQNIFTGDIFLDSDCLIESMENEAGKFVSTAAYELARSLVDRNRILMIVGDPGIGKTITSNMLVLNYAAKGYRIRYTSDFTDLAALKRSLSNSDEAKEIILLDDCFGQAYFEMQSSQESQLLALIRHVRLHPNKKLIMNSRVTIFREAQERNRDLVTILKTKELHVFALDMSYMKPEDKAKILYNHLYFSKLPKEVFQEIKRKKLYRLIIQHPNYNPRIVEFICNSAGDLHGRGICFEEFAINCLDNPEEIWKNEYERRFGKADRILSTTLCSISRTWVSEKLLKACFETRLMREIDIDSSINHFRQVTNRLNGSFIKIAVAEKDSEKHIALNNPSVIDFLENYISNNIVEYQSILSSIRSVQQIVRMLDAGRAEKTILSIIRDKSILQYVFESESQKVETITYYTSKFSVLDHEYRPYIIRYLSDIKTTEIIGVKNSVLPDVVLSRIFQQEYCEFYDLTEFLYDVDKLKTMVYAFPLETLVSFSESIDWAFQGSSRSKYVVTMKDLMKSAIEFELLDIPAELYESEIYRQLDDIIYDNFSEGLQDSELSEFAQDIAIECVKEEINICLSYLPEDLRISSDEVEAFPANVCGADRIIRAFSEDSDMESSYYYQVERKDDMTEVDYIFSR